MTLMKYSLLEYFYSNNVHYIKISVKFIGLDIEIKSKQKDAPSRKD